MVFLTFGGKASQSLLSNFGPEKEIERTELLHCAISAKETNLPQTNKQKKKTFKTVIAKIFGGRWMGGAKVVGQFLGGPLA